MSIEAETISENYYDMLKEHTYIGVIQPQKPADPWTRFQGSPALYSVGCMGKVAEFKLTGQNNIELLIEGISRFDIQQELSADKPYRLVQASYTDFQEDTKEAKQTIDRSRFLGFVEKYLSKKETDMLLKSLKPLSDQSLINALSMSLELSSAEKQALLEAHDLTDRADTLLMIFKMGFDFLKNEDCAQSSQLN